MYGSMGRLLIGVGGALVLVGLFFLLIEKIPGLKQLPGNIIVQRENFSLFMPLGTMILLSVLLTVVLNILVRLRR
jgi:hypothetical protein